ncbi:MAG TPA: N-formylglutamate deformylase [Rudaea sp.]|nr:N-formylglutamate deformylase [Rudaea sp.]
MTDTYTLHRGNSPLFVSLPHNGTVLPDDIAARLTDEARRVPDTDWHVAKLYAFAHELGASIIVPTYSRYVVDLNRPRDDASLYPGQNTTGLCPVTSFSGEPIYFAGREPTQNEIAARIETYWRPYHTALAEEIERIGEAHGRVVLWEGHSIPSVVPYLFEGKLADINIGTAEGASCSAGLQKRLVNVLEAQRDYNFVMNGRFKGGYITRHYGKPVKGVDAIQLELAQFNYMNEDTFEYDETKAARLQGVIRKLLQAALN